MIDTNNTVLLDDVSNVDNPEMVTLRTEIKTLMSTTTPTTTTGDTHAGKRDRVHKNGKTMKIDSEDILKSKKSNKRAFLAGFPVLEPNEEAVLDQIFVPDTTTSILDIYI